MVASCYGAATAVVLDKTWYRRVGSCGIDANLKFVKYRTVSRPYTGLQHLRSSRLILEKGVDELLSLWPPERIEGSRFSLPFRSVATAIRGCNGESGAPGRRLVGGQKKVRLAGYTLQKHCRNDLCPPFTSWLYKRVFERIPDGSPPLSRPYATLTNTSSFAGPRQ